MTALITNDTPVGHVYGWEIEPVSESECEVTNYTDWSAVPPRLPGALADHPVIHAGAIGAESRTIITND